MSRLSRERSIAGLDVHSNKSSRNAKKHWENQQLSDNLKEFCIQLQRIKVVVVLGSLNPIDLMILGRYFQKILTLFLSIFVGLQEFCLER